MTSYSIRTLGSPDFEVLDQLETAIFGSLGYAVLGPHYLRVCTEFYSETSFLAFCAGQPVGYLISFVRDDESYCTRLGVVPEHQGSRVTMQLIGAYIAMLVGRGVGTCWFTVKPSNLHARALYQRIGAVESGTVQSFLSRGDELMVQHLDQRAIAALHGKLVARR